MCLAAQQRVARVAWMCLMAQQQAARVTCRSNAVWSSNAPEVSTCTCLKRPTKSWRRTRPIILVTTNVLRLNYTHTKWVRRFDSLWHFAKFYMYMYLQILAFQLNTGLHLYILKTDKKHNSFLQKFSNWNTDLQSKANRCNGIVSFHYAHLLPWWSN